MSYEPTTWKDGDLVTSAKLNKLEQGVANGGGIQIIHSQPYEDTFILDKTWQEIYDGGFGVIMYEDEGSISYYPIGIVADLQIRASVGFGPLMTYTASSADAYPIFDPNGGGTK